MSRPRAVRQDRRSLARGRAGSLPQWYRPAPADADGGEPTREASRTACRTIGTTSFATRSHPGRGGVAVEPQRQWTGRRRDDRPATRPVRRPADDADQGDQRAGACRRDSRRDGYSGRAALLGGDRRRGFRGSGRCVGATRGGARELRLEQRARRRERR